MTSDTIRRVLGTASVFESGVSWPALILRAVVLVLVLEAVLAARPVSASEPIFYPDPTGGAGSWSSLQLDSSGFPVASYASQVDGNLRLLHCNDVNCAGGDDSISVVASNSLETALRLDAA